MYMDVYTRGEGEGEEGEVAVEFEYIYLWFIEILQNCVCRHID